MSGTFRRALRWLAIAGPSRRDTLPAGAGTRDHASDARERALQELWTAHAMFIAAYETVPDRALAYRTEGDDCSLGGLPIHVGHELAADVGLLRDLAPVIALPAADRAEMTIDAQFVDLDPADEAAMRDGPDPATGPSLRARLEDELRSVARVVLELPAAGFERRVPVVYSAGTDPVATSAADIVGRARDHAEEHGRQIGDLLDRWRGSSQTA